MINGFLFTKFNRAQLEQFRAYLDQQEAKLADALLLAALPAPGAILHLHGSGHVRLAQGVQILTTRIRELKEADTSSEEWKFAVKGTNHSLGEYVEVLQEAVKELLHQLKQMGLFSWNQDFYEIVAGFKELLSHRIEDLMWVFRRLEELFMAYRATCHKRKNTWVLFGKILRRFTTILDNKLLVKLRDADVLLNTEFKKFKSKFDAFTDFSEKEMEQETLVSRYACLIDLPPDRQSAYLKLYRMLKIWDQNEKGEAVLNQAEIAECIVNLAKAGLITSYFKDYLRVIRQRIFLLSRGWQESYDMALLIPARQLKEELSSLRQVVSTYREVLLRRDPIKNRWWFMGQSEHRKTRDLLQLAYEIEMVQKWVHLLLERIEKGKVEDHYFRRHALKREMDNLLHEMGQPLSSRGMLQLKAEGLIDLLAKADELGGSMGNVHEMLTDFFLKALRYDSKYQVLHDYPHFEELYAIHKGFMPTLQDSNHDKRMKLFQHVVHHVEYWVKEHAVQEHVNELEFDEVAVQEVLQQLLAAIQRKEPPQNNDWESYYQMLLEYRYLFSCFFHRLRNFEAEGKPIRLQFYFLDQYLDTIEKQLRH